MTAQDVFDKVYRHLMKQGKKSSAPHFPCAYRGEGGLMCAAGCLIPDKYYDPTIEGDSWLSDDVQAVAMKCGLTEHNRLISCLQSIHDNITVKCWAWSLSETAKNFGLTVPDMEAAQ